MFSLLYVILDIACPIVSTNNPPVQKDFPFRIRLPETIPPSIGLEKDAGIKYELVASVCVKGKRCV